MRRKIFLGIGAAAATLLSINPAEAQHWRWNEGGWRTIGYTRVNGRDSDTIYLPGPESTQSGLQESVRFPPITDAR
jgi:hypothetical protein